MKHLFRISIISSFLLISLAANSQNLFNQIDSIYGLDPTLYNGQYNPNVLTKDVKNHPFIYGPDFNKGTITIKGRIYKNINLNYDIYNQEILLKYKNNFGANVMLRLSKAWINKFTLDNNCFELIKYPESEKRIYQVIGHDSIKVLYYWEKDLDINQNAGSKKYHFSNPKKSMFVYKNKQIIKFKNKKSFIKIFDLDNQSAIKKYLKQNKIKIKKSSDKVMLNLITYCNNIKN